MSKRSGGSFLLGLGAGVVAGYAVARTFEALAPARDRTAVAKKDASAYALSRRRLEVAGVVRGLAGSLSFAYGPLAKSLDDATSRAPRWLRPALFAAPLSLAGAVLDLPVSYVEGYELERRFGLSEQTQADWLTEYAKASLLSAGLTTLVASLFGIAVRHAPKRWPLFASLGALPLFVLANIVVPLYVLPLFNTFEPVTGPLEERLRALAGRFGVGDAEILRMNMSRQTRKANAFVTGIGNTHRIVLGDTLIEAFPDEETEFVVAHELGHYVHKDTWRLIGLAEALAIALFLIAQGSTPRRDREELRYRPLLLLRFYAAMSLATQVLRPLLLAFSRSREWAADRFALDATHDAASGAAAFRRLRDQNLADEDPPDWYEIFFSSHPSLRARIAALEPASS